MAAVGVVNTHNKYEKMKLGCFGFLEGQGKKGKGVCLFWGRKEISHKRQNPELVTIISKGEIRFQLLSSIYIVEIFNSLVYMYFNTL